MRRVLKWLGILVGGLVGLIVLALAVVYIVTSVRIGKTYDVPAVAISIPSGEEAIAEGKRLVTIRGCTGCHGDDLSGQALIEDPVFAKIYSANLTGGQGSEIGEYDDAMLVRAIRDGVSHDDKPLIVMPSYEYHGLSEEDVGSIVAYIRSLPAVDHEQPDHTLGPLGRIFYLAGQIPVISAELIDHDAPRPEAPEVGETVAYGEYLATTCTGCHHEDFAGGPLPGAGPDDPIALNLTPGGELAGWSEEDFITTIRTGVTPGGSQLEDEMPWKEFRQMTDTELKAIWLYLQSLPALEQRT